LLAVLVALGAALVLGVRAPVREPGLASRRGHRVFRVQPGTVRTLELRSPNEQVVAHRTEDGWQVDGARAEGALAVALDDLLGSVVHLRAVDVFRPRDAATYGLDRPRATVVVHTERGARRVVLGAANAAGSAFYARRDGDPRVMQVGSLLLAEIERVFFARSRRPQPPEIG
jgi:hypothetical protein